MAELIPSIILQGFHQKEFFGEFEGGCLFVDISGFTPLTEGLMKHGIEGAEVLSALLNTIFEPMVQAVYDQGGLIPYFMGDAFIGIYRGQTEQVSEAMLRSSQVIQDFFRKGGLQKTKFGNFQLGVKQGLGIGIVNWGILGKENKTFFFKGQAIDQATDAEKYADKGDVIIHKSVPSKLFDGGQVPEIIEDNIAFSRLFSFPAFAKKNRSKSTGNNFAEALPAFLPPSVLGFKGDGEFRQVVSIFMAFDGSLTGPLLNEFASIVMENLLDHGGYFKEIDFGDKGAMMLAFFGAPVAYEQNEERALEFVLSLKQELETHSTLRKMRFKTGLTKGEVFAGLIGGSLKQQYACLGDRVNLAARLMVKAEWGETLVDQLLSKTKGFSFLPIGEVAYKGVEKRMPTYKLLGLQTEASRAYPFPFVGMEKAQENLKTYLTPIIQGQFAGLIQISGEAGIGKSRLAYEVVSDLVRENKISWVTFRADDVLQRSFYPILQFIRLHFQQKKQNDLLGNQAVFEEVFRSIMDGFENHNSESQVRLKKNIRASKNILQGVLGIASIDMPWHRMDAKARYENTLSAFKYLLFALSVNEPLILEFEDLQSIDADSEQLLKGLLKNPDAFPIAILTTSREVAGAKKSLAEGIKGLLFQEIVLNPLSKSGITEMVQGITGLSPKKTLSAFLEEKGRGVPLFVEELLAFLETENKLQKVEKEVDIDDETAQLPVTASAIFSARIDRLENWPKELLKIAAVLGKSFDEQVLEDVFLSLETETNEIAFQEFFDALQESKMLEKIGDEVFFDSGMLRDAAYQMQLKKRLKEIHLKAGKVIEQLFEEELAPKYSELAYHYEGASHLAEAKTYYEKAGDFFKDEYRNAEAIRAFDKLISLLGKDASVLFVNVSIKKAIVQRVLGDLKASKSVLLAALEKAEEEKAEESQAKVIQQLGQLFSERGEYHKALEFANRALKFYQKNDQKSKEESTIYTDIGLCHLNLSELEEANVFFEKAATSADHFSDDKQKATALSNKGSLFLSQGKIQEAILVFEEQEAILKKGNFQRLKSNALGNLGIAYMQIGSFDKAIRNLIEYLKICEEMGLKQGVSMATGNLGVLYLRQEKFDEAIECHHKYLDVSRELGDKRGEFIALGNIGSTYRLMSSFENAIPYYEKAAAGHAEIGFKFGLLIWWMEMADCFLQLTNFSSSLIAVEKGLVIAIDLQKEDSIIEGAQLKVKLLKRLNEIPKIKPFLNSLEKHIKKEEFIKKLKDISLSK